MAPMPPPAIFRSRTYLPPTWRPDMDRLPVQGLRGIPSRVMELLHAPLRSSFISLEPLSPRVMQSHLSRECGNSQQFMTQRIPAVHGRTGTSAPEDRPDARAPPAPCPAHRAGSARSAGHHGAWGGLPHLLRACVPGAQVRPLQRRAVLQPGAAAAADVVHGVADEPPAGPVERLDGGEPR